MQKITSFDLKPGQRIGGKYEIISMLGKGLEGEVYLICEVDTGIERTAKVFLPQHNPYNRTVRHIAKKLHKVRSSNFIVQYMHQEKITVKRQSISCVISEFIDAELLCDFVQQFPGKRLHYYQGLHILFHLAKGLERLHKLGEYHGDIHDSNVFVKPVGIGFEVKLIDPFNWKDSKSLNMKRDILDLIRLFYDCLGGAKHYRNQPDIVKEVCCGLKAGLINQKFPNASALRVFLENFDW